MENGYGYVKEVGMSFGEALGKTKEVLKERGFGVLTEIDVRKTLKDKTGAEMDDYVILGMCNPNFARKALENEKNIGLLLPCNAIVYRKDGKTFVGVVSAKKMLSVVKNAEMESTADEVENMLRSAFDAL